MLIKVKAWAVQNRRWPCLLCFVYLVVFTRFADFCLPVTISKYVEGDSMDEKNRNPNPD